MVEINTKESRVIVHKIGVLTHKKCFLPHISTQKFFGQNSIKVIFFWCFCTQKNVLNTQKSVLNTRKFQTTLCEYKINIF